MRAATHLIILASLTFFATTPPIHAQVTMDSSSNAFVYHHSDGGSDHYYSYAPSVIVDGGTEYIYTCHNSNADQIVDNVWLTEIDTSSGQVGYDWHVLQPTSGSWDSQHTCDPTVIKSNVTFDGNAYSYLMFYLGTDQTDGNHNQIGLAMANAPEGPWIKFPYPVVGYDTDNPSGCHNDGKNSCWGVGQPSVTSVDGNGRILIFWSGTAGSFRGDVNVANINSSGSNPVWNSWIPVTSQGLTDMNGSSDWLNNYDMAYDFTRDRFYAIREQHDNSIDYCSASNPTNICQTLQVVSIAGSDVWSGGGSWSVEAGVTPGLTGSPRNHNAGIFRNWYGGLLDSSETTIMYTVSCADGTSDSCNGGDPLWTYSLWRINGTIQ